jgi:hypothetical protein
MTRMSAWIRLERDTPSARQARVATIIGVVLTVLGGGAITLLIRIEAPADESSEWLFYIVGSAFLLVGLVMVILAIKMFLALRLPETIVEVDRMPVRAGKPFRVTVRQPGPIRLESLRLNLVGEQLTRREVWRNGRRRTDTDRRLIHQDNVLDLKDITILPGDEVARQGEATVPAAVTLADIDGQKRVVWRLEVWGRVRGWVDFGHPFMIEVLGQSAREVPPADEEW